MAVSRTNPEQRPAVLVLNRAAGVLVGGLAEAFELLVGEAPAEVETILAR